MTRGQVRVGLAGAPLPQDLLPGDRARVSVPLGRGLPRGDYVVGIDLLQIDGGWFHEEPPRLTGLHVR
jgi:hypothetical protein